MRTLLFLAVIGCNSSTPSLPPYDRKLVTRPLMATSPLNLLRDPLVGGDGSSYGQFSAYYENGGTIPLHRTFRSVSPVGGMVSIGEFRDLPDPGGATAARIMASFLGGPGSFHASVWLSAADFTGSPLPFSDVASSVEVALLGNDGMSKAVLTAGEPVSYGARQWVHLAWTGTLALPAGGWLSVRVKDFGISLQLAAPEVTSSALDGAASNASLPSLMNDGDRDAVRRAQREDRQPPRRPPTGDR